MCDDRLVVLTDEEWLTLLSEGEKSISTHRDPESLIMDLGGPTKTPSRSFLKMGYSNDLRELKERYRKRLTALMRQVANRDVTFNESANLFARAFRTAFSLSYAMGMRKQGVGEDLTAREIVKHKFTAADRDHINTMVSEEMRYMRKFLTERLDPDAPMKMNIDRRIKLYVEGLDSVFMGARTAALPADSLMYWHGPKDDAKCLSCLYLMLVSPFIKANLPAQPKDGSTLCLSNCRDQLVVRTGTHNEIRRAYQGYTKSQHQGVLDMIKRDRKRLKPSDIRMIAQRASSGLSRP